MSTINQSSDINEICLALKREYVGVQRTYAVRRLLTNIRIVEGYHHRRQQRLRRYNNLKNLPIIGSFLSVLISLLENHEIKKSEQIRRRLFLAYSYHQVLRREPEINRSY